MVYSWRPLPVVPHPDLPPVLLVAATFDPAASSYAVAITDLAHVWIEALDRRQICMRAFQENTTIDPSYDNEQMGVFLGKLDSALSPASGGEGASNEGEETRLSLASSGDGNLTLHITCILPAGLAPLKWPLHLKRQPPTAIAPSLVVPLLQDRALHQRAASLLKTSLREKDTLINKLVDKLDALSAGVESAFPSLAGGGGGGGGGGSKRKLSRADLERRVKGLAPFDEQLFKKQLGQTEGLDGEGGVSHLIDAFGEVPCDDPSNRSDSGSTSNLPQNLETWWEELGSGLGIRLQKWTNVNGGGATDSKEVTAASEVDDDDGFQTTPSAKKAVKTQPLEDPPSPTPNRATASNVTSAKAKSGGLGKIGRGKKAKAASPPPPSPPPPPRNEAEDDETASEPDEPRPTSAGKAQAKASSPEDDAAVEEATSTITTASLRTKPARSGLGRISGKKAKETEPSPEPSSPPPKLQAPQETKVADASPAKTKMGLGRIGKGARRETSHVASGDDSEVSNKREAESQTVAKKESPTPAPDSPAKAEGVSDSKRAEILRQAMEKHAAPVRKKRKF